MSCGPSCRLIKHTNKLMDKEEKLCIKILQTLREMLDKKESFHEAVRNSLLHVYTGGIVDDQASQR